MCDIVVLCIDNRNTFHLPTTQWRREHKAFHATRRVLVSNAFNCQQKKKRNIITKGKCSFSDELRMNSSQPQLVSPWVSPTSRPSRCVYVSIRAPHMHRLSGIEL